MGKLTVGAFAAGLNSRIGEHGGDEIESIRQANDGYILTAKDQSGDAFEIPINAAEASSATHDMVDDEIAMYSVMENIAYIAWLADKMIATKTITDVPRPKLVAAVIQIADEFDREHGSDFSGGDTVKTIEQYAEQMLLEKFR